MTKNKFSYDSVPYPSYTFPQTNPDRLATMAALFGMDPAAPTESRVLEIGCGDGSNLMSFAYALPDSRFTGIDLSEVHIARANEAVKYLGLVNITFRQADVCELNLSDLGKFDYIIAHGLFSWVPDVVRPHILKIYAECLAPNGVGYISYNAYPGCKIREITSGIMRYQTDGIEVPSEKVGRGIEFLRLITGAAENESLYQSMLKLELEQILNRSTENVFHDDLSTFNQPFYFHEFASMIEPFGLQFLSEADPISSNAGKFAAETRKILESIGEDVLRREQYIDLITCRRFRSTLICRSDIELDRKLTPEITGRFYISSQTRPNDAVFDVRSDSPVRFIGVSGASLEINHPLTKAALTYLYSIWPGSLTLDDLFGGAEKLLARVSSEEDRLRASTYIMQMFNAGFVKFGRFQPELAVVAGEYPKSSKFARWQIDNGAESVTTLAGKNLKVEDVLLRLLISLLDGTRDRRAIAEGLMEIIELPEDEKAAFAEQLPEMIEDQLEQLVGAGLLIA